VAGPGDPGGPPSNKLIAPIRVQGKAAAVLILERRGDAPHYSTDERELLEEVASRAGLALENARLLAEAELATRSRDRMLSVVAHDLRNPLAVVAMYGEMLLSMLPPDGDEYSRGALTSIHQTTGRIQRLVEDLLDVSSLEQGVFSLQRVDQPLEPLLVEAERMLRPLAEARGIELSFEGESDSAKRLVPVDSTRLIQLLSNLVGNALKFTPSGGKVVVSWRPAGPLMELSVTDTGPGIPADQLPHVFGAFWQARDADRRGVGLGLWIARAIVEGHDGRIWVDSVAGRGAAFRFTLPAAEPAESRPITIPPVLIGG
jgi:signal transduction histidine kinase